MPDLDDIISAGQAAASAPTKSEASFSVAAPSEPAPTSLIPPDRLDLIASHAPAPETPTAKDSGMLANVGAGTSEAVAQLLGAPMDLYTTALGVGVRGINSLLGTHIPQPTHYGGTGTWESAEGLIGADPRQVQAATEPERVARSAARMATATALPGAVAGVLPAASGTAGAIQEAIASGATPSGVAAGAGAGASGEFARYGAPDPLKNLAEMAGNLVGSGVTAFGAQALRTGARLATEGPMVAGRFPGSPVIDPETGQAALDAAGNPIGAREAFLAGHRIAAASPLQTAEEQLLQQAAPRTEIEDFTPTLGQETGDLGTLSLERELRNRYRDIFIQHDAVNNAALRQAMGQLAPEEAGDAAGSYVRSLLGGLQAGEGLDQTAFKNVARGRVQALGGEPASATASDLGAAARERLDQLRQPIRAAASHSLDQVDPDGTLALSARPVAEAAANLMGGAPAEGAEASPFAINPRAGERPASAEMPILNAAAQMNGVVTFQDLRALLGQVGAAQRAIRSDPALGAESRPYARMRALRQSIEDAMVSGAEETATERSRPAAEVPEDALARLQQAITAQRDQWYGARQEGSAETGTLRPDVRGNAGGGQGAIPGAPGASGAAFRGSGNAPGMQAVPPEALPLTANFDAEAAARLAVANRAYADYKQRFRQGPVGEVLASGNTPQGYRLGDSQVVTRLFRPGAQGGEAIDSLIRATGSPESALQVLGDYPAYSFRSAAERNGMIDPKAAERWIASHKETLDRLPQLRAQFEDATQASRAVGESAVRWKAAREDIENSALGRFLNADPQHAIQRIMGGQNPQAEAADLMRRVAGTPAEDGIRRNVVDWLMNRMQGTAEAATTGEREMLKAPLQRVLQNPGQVAALRTILGPDRFAMLGKISDALDTAARAYQAVAIKGSPGTAADLHAIGVHGQPSLLAWAWIAEKAAELGGHLLELGGPAGAVARLGAAGGAALMRMARQNGIDRVDQLAAQGVLDPKLGRILLGQAAKSERDPRFGLLGRQLQALTMPAAIQGMQEESEPTPQHKHGGHVETEEHLHHEALSPAYHRDGGRIRLRDGGQANAKLGRDAFLYMHPHGNKGSFAQCSTCRLFMPRSEKCAVLDTHVEPRWSCGLYAEGRPDDNQEATASATPEEVGLTRMQVRCENCAAFDGKDSCHLFERLNRDEPDLWSLDTKVEALGCCNGWSPKRQRRADGGVIMPSDADLAPAGKDWLRHGDAQSRVAEAASS